MFHYAYVNGASVAQASVYWLRWGTNEPAKHRRSDWVIGRLSRRLGDRYGWLAVSAVDLTAISGDRSITLTGYSGDYRDGRVATMATGCSFRGVEPTGVVRHDCDSTRGASGAPLVRVTRDASGVASYEIVALDVAERRDGDEESLIGIDYDIGHANLAISAGEFLPALQNL
jgi:hypothetical protein